MSQGIFITFEGIEGCGKSTQSKLLYAWLQEQGYEVLLTREPGGPRVSEAIRSILLDPTYEEMLPETELLLYQASRSQHTGQWILPALEQGKFVISDRYYDSTYAYQGAARSMDREMIARLNHFASFGREPDITFLLDMPAEAGLDRIADRHQDRLERENLLFHQRVRDEFLQLAAQNPKRFYTISAEQSIDEIQQQVILGLQYLLRDRTS